MTLNKNYRVIYFSLWNWYFQDTLVLVCRAWALLFASGLFLLQASDLSAQGTSTHSTAYRLQAGDSFTTLYRLTPEYNQTVIVQPNGDIMLQLIGPMNVGGLTLPQVAELIRDKAAVKLNKPEISVELKDYDKPHFVVLGEVGSPGRFELHGNLTVAEGLALAGGLKPSARHNNIILIRPLDSDIGETKLINFKTLEKRQVSLETQLLPSLKPGDILIVPTSKLSKLERYVKIVNTGVYYNPGNP